MPAIGTHADGRPFGMPRKAYAVFMDRQRWKDFVLEYGGEDECMAYVCAQVASGVSLKALSEHYVVDYGLLWEFVSNDIEKYELAQRGVAEYYVAETVSIADEQNEVVRPNGGTYDPDVARDKLRVDTRMKVASRWNRPKYGEVAQTQINVGANSLVAILQGLPSAQVEAERQERLEAAPELAETERIEDVQVVLPTNAPEKIPAEIPKYVEMPELRPSGEPVIVEAKTERVYI